MRVQPKLNSNQLDYSKYPDRNPLKDFVLFEVAKSFVNGILASIPHIKNILEEHKPENYEKNLLDLKPIYERFLLEDKQLGQMSPIELEEYIEKNKPLRDRIQAELDVLWKKYKNKK